MSSTPAVLIRRGYLRFAQLQEHLAALAIAWPDLVRLERIGSTSAGRPLYVVVVGRDPERTRPALWMDANMHANELLGTNVALAFVDDLLALHAGDNRHSLSAAVVAKAKDALVYVMPTLSPDGAEAIFADGRFVRSSPSTTVRPRDHTGDRSTSTATARYAACAASIPAGVLSNQKMSRA